MAARSLHFMHAYVRTDIGKTLILWGHG